MKVGPGIEHIDMDQYDGYFVNNLREGRGKLLEGNGQVYEGSFY